MGSSTAGASACLAYTRERRRTRTRLRRLLTALAEREDASCGSVGSGSCAQGLSHPSWAARRPPNVHRRRAANLTGVWIGNFTLGCVPPLASTHCLIRQDISFTFVQHETTVSGFYQCSVKDHPCIAHQHGGKVTRIENSGRVLLIRVRMDDGSSCTFGATAQNDNEMSGGCICFELWGQQKSWWHAQRAY